LAYWIPTNSGSGYLFDNITFSSDSELAIIETDQFNPLEIINLTSLRIVHSIAINDTILYAHFLNSSNRFVSVICSNSFIIVDLHTSTLYPVASTGFSADSYASDYSSNVFVCQNGANIITQQNITFTKLSIHSSSTMNNSVNTSNPTKNSSST
jgi:hypothetical protein